jgi:hypothetical protein
MYDVAEIPGELILRQAVTMPRLQPRQRNCLNISRADKYPSYNDNTLKSNPLLFYQLHFTTSHLPSSCHLYLTIGYLSYTVSHGTFRSKHSQLHCVCAKRH